MADDVPTERPRLRVLMAFANPSKNGPPKFALVDIFQVTRRQRMGWLFVALDPADEAAFLAWRSAHPEV